MRTEPGQPEQSGETPPGSRSEVGGDAALAVHLARAAGQVLLACRREADGLSDHELRDLGDASAQDLLAAELARLAPGDAVLSEEAADDAARLDGRPRLDHRPARRHA